MKTPNRYLSIDILRGLIMVLMAIDHSYLTIYQVHYTESWSTPLPDYANSAIFFTRWISNICAPGFTLLMGLSMALYYNKYSSLISAKSIRWFFIQRGLVIILLQQFLNLPSLLFDINNLHKMHVFTGGVLYMLGSSMIICSFLIKVKTSIKLFIGATLIIICYLFTNFIFIEPSDNSFINLFLLPGVNKWVSVNYPVLPWLGISIIGLAVGDYFIIDKKKLMTIALRSSIILLFLFIFLRVFNLGDYNHNISANFLVNLLAVIKYPPSIAFLVLTLSILFFLFWGIDKNHTTSLFKPLVVFGQAPLFFYFAHYFLYIVLSKFTNHAVPLYVMYLIWAFGLFLLFPIVKFYSQFKNKQGKDSFWKYL